MDGWPLDRASEREFAAVMAPLFEEAPRFIERLAAGRPYGSWERLFERAVEIALAMSEDERVELVDAHPRIGAPPGSISGHSYVEQGYDREAGAEHARVDQALERLNGAYEARFGFRYVIFVAGRPRADIVPLMEAALSADREAEMERALRDVVAIARDRAAKTGRSATEAGGAAPVVAEETGG